MAYDVTRIYINHDSVTHRDTVILRICKGKPEDPSPDYYEKIGDGGLGRNHSLSDIKSSNLIRFKFNNKRLSKGMLARLVATEEFLVNGFYTHLFLKNSEEHIFDQEEIDLVNHILMEKKHLLTEKEVFDAYDRVELKLREILGNQSLETAKEIDLVMTHIKMEIKEQ